MNDGDDSRSGLFFGLLAVVGLILLTLHSIRDIFGTAGIYATAAGVLFAVVLQLKKVLLDEQPGAGWQMLFGALGCGFAPIWLLGRTGIAHGLDERIDGPVWMLLAAWFPLVMWVGQVFVEPKLVQRRANRRG